MSALHAGGVDFANILFAGPCNRFCPWCIGKQITSEASVTNLHTFPPTNIETFIAEVNRLDIRHVVFTGTTTDPQLYKHEGELLRLLRESIRTNPDYSLHTNGVLALKKLLTFNSYDKVCISFPSFNPRTYKKLMGVAKLPNLAAIVRAATVPLKVSCVLNQYNFGEAESFLEECHRIGVERIVFRRLYGDTRNWNPLRSHTPHRYFRQNPLYEWRGIEVTYWEFDAASSTSINLFANGVLGESYLLPKTEFGRVREDTLTLPI